MRKNQDNPESLDKLNAIPLTDEIKDFVNDLSTRVSEEKSARAFWEQTIDKHRALRYGFRSEKNFPWPKCANYSLPLIDSELSRIKPAYANLVNIYPIVNFEPYGAEDMDTANNREIFFDWKLRTRGEFQKNYLLGIDYLLEQGVVVFKTSWKYSTRNYALNIDLSDLGEQVLNAIYDPRVTDDVLYQILVEEYRIDDAIDENVKELRKAIEKFRKGETQIEILLLEKKDDHVEIEPCSVREDILFPLGTTNLNEARFIDYIFCVNKNDLKIAMRDGKYNKYSDDEMESWSEYSPNTDRKSRKQAQYLDKYNDNIWLHETCVWYDINNDGIEERCIVTWPDASPNNVLRLIELPYEHGEWPYVMIRREINDPGPYASRGVPALLEDFQTGISTAFNQSVDNGTITNTPQVVMRRGAVSNIRNLRYVPANVIETNGPTSDYEIRQLGNVSQNPLFMQSQYLKSWADQRTGNLYSGLSATNNLPGEGQGGKKTAKEISAIEFMSGQTMSLDLLVFQIQMAKVYQQADALYQQFESEDEFQIITNNQPMKISRAEIQGKFNVVPNGRIDNTDPQLRMQRSFNLMKVFLNDPDIKQRELKKMFLDDMDIKLSMKLFKTEEEIAQENAQMQQQMAEQMKIQDEMQNHQIQKQLNTQSIMDDLEVRKSALLKPIEGAKYAPG